MADNDPGGTKTAPARLRVYDYVREGILDGRFAGGTFLEEEHVSAAVGVSRTPVREAFQQLQAERLIDLLPRRGAMVRIVTVPELMEVYEARLMIETHAVRRLCSARLGPPVLLSRLLAEMQGQADASDLVQARLNSQFHRALVDAAGNAVVTSLYDSLNARQERVAITALGIGPERRALIQEEHAALVAAIASHDAAAAVAVLTEHLRPVREIVARLPEPD